MKTLRVTFLNRDGEVETQDVPVLLRLGGRIRARRAMNRGFKYRATWNGKCRIVWIAPSRIIQCTLD